MPIRTGLNLMQGAMEKAVIFFLAASHKRLLFMTVHFHDVVKFSNRPKIYRQCLRAEGRDLAAIPHNMATIVLD